MENNNQNVERTNVPNKEILKIKYEPTVSYMFVSDTDLGTIVAKNLSERFAGVVGVRVVKSEKKGLCPIQIMAYFQPNSDAFERTMNPAIASLIKADHVFTLAPGAKELLRPFIPERQDVEIKTVNTRKKGGSVVEIKLNPMLTLSSVFDIPKGTLINISDIKMTSKVNFEMSIQNFKKPVRNNNQKKNKNRNK